MKKFSWAFFAPILGSLSLSPVSHAQWAVIDVGAITQLVQQVATLERQLQTAEATLTNAQQQFQATVGNRGMQNLLPTTNRNYLPSSWTQLIAAVGQTGGAYQALSGAVQSLMVANAVLTPQQVAALSPARTSRSCKQPGSRRRFCSRPRASRSTIRVPSSHRFSNSSMRYRVPPIRRGHWICKLAFKRNRPCCKTRTRK